MYNLVDGQQRKPWPANCYIREAQNLLSLILKARAQLWLKKNIGLLFDKNFGKHFSSECSRRIKILPEFLGATKKFETKKSEQKISLSGSGAHRRYNYNVNLAFEDILWFISFLVILFEVI